ncbi:beta-galactosidase [Paenibacillus glycanilyticus]|uniref:Beta-galactosidase n=1 Tax=Paenibacillus glycanilyticus TaxID=126569 RepID=A0ABQ6NHC1_9BACL|nr:beta-galactosidase [Paenibacillus glycanilyticus]GMK43545.1 beta-galactosidase [Paenibacillus glycanilyticus]
MKFGVCYYPEHWPEERWPLDAKLMREAGINIVRIGEFAWSKLERRPGEYTFEWLDRSLSILASEGIRVVLGTPTATPPKWLMDRHPDLYMRDNKGIARGFGHRRHYCYNHPDYPVYIQSIVTQLATRYGACDNVAAWQIDNEFGCTDTTRCYCDNCRTAFQQWLEAKYGNIDNLNEQWGTVFWSQIYNAFSEIELPAYTVFPLHNPGMELDFRRFSSDSAVRFQQLQLGIIRSLAPHQPITHNMMGMFNEINDFDLSKELDFASLDNYPNLMFADKPDPRSSALALDATRGFKQANFWMMEHQSGPPGGNMLFPTPKPGELRKWTYQSVAHGADAILYFRWRTCLFGAEQFWHGLLPHDGIPGRRYEEAARTGEELQRLLPLMEGIGSGAEVAMIRSYENEWAMEIQPQTYEHRYDRHFQSYYGYFYDSRIPVDVISDDRPFDSYKLVVLPHYMMAKPGVAERLERYAAAGGTVVLDIRAGTKLWNNRMDDATLPGTFRELLGIRITDYGTLRKGETRRIAEADGEVIGQGTVWYDVIDCEKAEPIAWYAEDYMAGTPAATRNAVGEGEAYYFGIGADPACMRSLMNRVCESADVHPITQVSGPEEVELARRADRSRSFIFAINHAGEERSLQLAGPMRELISDRVMEGAAVIPAYGAYVFAGA